MNNPAMLQQSMQMAQQLGMGGMGSVGNSAEPQTTPPANPFAAMMAGAAPQSGTNSNPMAAMMQQMMSNPAMMEQSMQMARALGAQPGAANGFPAMFGAPREEEPAVLDENLARARFASQLVQLSAMGFCNEAACLRALQQHQGRIDAAIDTLLSGSA